MTLRHHTAMSRTSLTRALALGAIVSGCNQAPPTYSASCATPLPHWKTERDGVGHLLVVVPVFLATDGSVLWSKAASSDDRLRSYMREASAMSPMPQIVLQVSPSTSCRRIREVRSIMDAAPMCKGPYSRCSEGWKLEEWPMLGGP